MLNFTCIHNIFYFPFVKHHLYLINILCFVYFRWLAGAGSADGTRHSNRLNIFGKYSNNARHGCDDRLTGNEVAGNPSNWTEWFKLNYCVSSSSASVVISQRTIQSIHLHLRHGMSWPAMECRAYDLIVLIVMDREVFGVSAVFGAFITSLSVPLMAASPESLCWETSQPQRALNRNPETHWKCL